MIPAEMVLGFFSSAKNGGRRVKISGTEKGTIKGTIRDVKMENRVITVDIEGEIVVIDMNVCEVKTSFWDHRVLHVRGGEDSFKIQLA